MMVSLLLFAAMHQAQPGFEFDVRRGLRISVEGVPLVTGSWLQYYEDGWTKSYYSSSNDDPQVQSIDADDWKVTYSGDGGLSTGQISYHRAGNHLTAHYDLRWGGPMPVKIELATGMISAQVMQTGSLIVDGRPARSMAATTYAEKGMETRKFAPDGSDYVFDAPLARLEVKTSSPTTLFDARGYDQDYATGKSVFWFGALSLDVSKDKPVSFDVDWQVNPKPFATAAPVKLELTCRPYAKVITPDETPPLIIPKPRTNELKFDKPMEITGAYAYPAGHVRFWESDFIGGLKRRFEMPAAQKNATPINVDGGVSKLGFHPGAYQITITSNSISVLGEEDEGLHNGLRRLALLAFPHNGKLMLPTGYISSNPQILWRGVHLFVGPDARSFQKKLWDRVLLPLGFNKVVLECERTEWDSMPNMKGVPGNMAKQDLAGLFEDYRAIGVEPIPLIQSFGHMDWFFANKQNLDVAVNPDVPFTLDPRKPRSKEMLSAIWDEACDLLKPSTIHFGCDEIDLRGFPTDDASLVTSLWKLQMPVLKEIADKHQAQMILWGDKGLAPGEAIDATGGDTKEDAKARREAIPTGAWIADWHYKADNHIEWFLPSLQLWKKDHLRPIATAWYQPDNVRSMDLAADVEKLGTLQTTWPGYFSNEQSLIENMDQFSAMVLAADYSWSTRYDQVSKLGYSPGEVFRKMYFGLPRSIVAEAGTQTWQGTSTKDLTDGDMCFKIGEPIGMRSLLSAPQAPSILDLGLTGKGRHIAIAMDALDRCDEGEVLATLTVRSAAGKAVSEHQLLYGRQVRASDDSASMPYADRVDGLSVWECDLPMSLDVRDLHLEAVSTRGGLRIHGMIVW